MNQKTLDPETDADPAAREQHHGDLRKGAYLRRRAEYQMQANSAGIAQAGTLTPPGTTYERKRRGG